MNLLPKIPCILLLGGWGLFATFGAELPVTRWQGRTMGSPYVVQIVGANLASEGLTNLQGKVEQRLAEVNRQMSHYDPASELSRFNRAPPHKPFKVSPEFARVVRFALDVCRRSDGAFDPTLGPVINLWGFGERTGRRAVPAEADLQAARAQTGCQHLRVTPEDELIKDVAGLQLNLSAVAKGFGVDEIVRLLGREGWTNIYAAIAGDVRVMGHNPQGAAWRVGVSAPVAHWTEADPLAAVAVLTNLAISTSGDYQKFFTNAAGQRLSHIFDPRTGQPVQNTVGGVSVTAPDSMTADALSTTLFVLGPERGRQLIAGWTEVAALFLLEEAGGAYRQSVSPHFPLGATED